MKTKYFLSLLCSIAFFGQGMANVTEIERCSNYEKGTITFKNGKTAETYIYIDHCNPNRHQQGLSTVSEKNYIAYSEGKKIKSKDIETYKPKDILGYVLENGKEYRQIKYSNMLSTKKTDMIPKRYFLEVVADGDITLFKKHYRTENGFIYKPVSESKFDGGPEHLEFMVKNFELLFQKDKESNPKNIRNTNLKEVFGDNTEVLKKFQDGDYAFREQFQRQATFAVNCDHPFMDALLEMVNEYNGIPSGGVTSSTFQD
ncbi:MAG: hypothetical protein ACJA1P_000729 [Maribacter sp.]|jgi:hypothetical protein